MGKMGVTEPPTGYGPMVFSFGRWYKIDRVIKVTPKRALVVYTTGTGATREKWFPKARTHELITHGTLSADPNRKESATMAKSKKSRKASAPKKSAPIAPATYLKQRAAGTGGDGAVPRTPADAQVKVASAVMHLMARGCTKAQATDYLIVVGAGRYLALATYGK